MKAPTRVEVIEVTSATRRLLERLAAASEHKGTRPSIASVVATLAQTEAVRRERANGANRSR